MIKSFFIYLFLCSSINASTLFAPDGDTALLLQILGTEIEATVGILEMIDISSETLNKIEEVHMKTEDMYTRAMQAEYYLNVLGEFPDNLERGFSMVKLRKNLYKARDIYNDRSTLTLGYDLLKQSNDQTSKILSQKVKRNKFDNKLAHQYLKMAGNSSKTADGAVYGARASALGTVTMVGMNDSLNLLNYQALVRNDYILSQERKKHFEEYSMKMRWGMIPADLSFKEYLTSKTSVRQYVKHRR